MTKSGKNSAEWKRDQEERAIFFDEKSSEFKIKETANKLQNVDGQQYEWNLDGLQISQKAWQTVIHSNRHPVEVFCHPEIVTQDEHFVLYYQFLAMISGKSISHLGFSSNYETNCKRFKKDHQEATRYARRINELVSTLVENNPDGTIEKDDLTIWRAMQAGSTSGGSWRNHKGDMEEIRIKRQMFQEFKNSGHIPQDKEYESAFGFSIPLVGTEYVLEFKSEPDIGIRKSDAKQYEIVVEIKGGIDPAGVLERYGAILKSFRSERSKNPGIKTYLTTQRAAYTDEAKERITSTDEITEIILIDGLDEGDYEDAAASLVSSFQAELHI